ncbi:MAG TPA: SUMF1/EgtB/PvdO family nonheme iron enzyme, partial [Anaerolineales bacterium]|nr:SUMF1/EgtB/PvdO family nonheme iron enzyme [Anaerolineales bacterium]
MKHLGWISLVIIVAAACAPTPAPTPTLAPATQPVPPTQVPPTATAALAPAVLAGPQAGSSMRWIDGSELLYVPSGDFIIGNDQGSTPQKTVYLDAFWIYASPVTNRMYTQCVATGNCAPPAQEIGSPVYSNPLYGDFPVVGVTWDMAANYCGWAQAQLPTEAQWEKAARGEDGAVYPWGIAAPSCNTLNFKGCVGHSTSVLDFPDGRSPYGVYDMAGNVFQWVNDFYDEHAYDAMADRNPTGPAAGSSHVLRGSSYETEKSILAS